MGRRGDGPDGGSGVRVGVVGIAHPHVWQITASLLTAGAELAAVHGRPPAAAAEFASAFGDAPVRDQADAVLGDDQIDVVVVVTVPDERARVAARAMDAGRDVLIAKPAALTDADVALLRETQARTARICAVYLSERIEDRATLRASGLVADGAIGRVVHVGGSGPHRLGLEARPRWFVDPDRAGGILTDLATHQIDQFLHFTGLTAVGTRTGPDEGAGTEPDVVEIVSAAIANHAHPELEGFADHGEIHLRRGAVSGFVRVDWLTPAGLPTWGDVRLFLHGTEGTIELRKNIDVGGAPGGDHLLLVDRDGVQRIDCSDDPLPFASRFLDDVRTRGRSDAEQAHDLLVCELAVTAQRRATRHGHLAAPEDQ